MPAEHPQQGRLVSFVLPVSLGIALALAMTWPLALYLGSEIPVEWGDPLFDTWHVAWVGHALLEQPLDLFQANRFWPERDSLAFNDIMLGYGPLGMIGAQSPGAALVVHNLLVLFAYMLAFVGAYLLARELGAHWPGAVVAGAAFAYAPWRLAHVRHLNVISSGGIPLALFLLIRGYRRGSGRTVIAGWLVATWQMTLGFSLGLQFAYLLLVLGVIAGISWLRSGAPRPTRAVLRATVIGVCLLGLTVALLARPYLRVVDEHAEATRSKDVVAFFSPSPSGFLAAPPENLIWGDATADTRDSFTEPIEQVLFPGVAITLLALLGLGSAAYPAGLRIGLGAGVVVTSVLSMGLPHLDGDAGYTPYRFLYDFAPGWDGVRTPTRINTLTSLGLALLAGAGVSVITKWLRDGRYRPVLATAALTATILVEGFGPIAHYGVPVKPVGQARAAAPQLHLPSGYRHDIIYTYWTIPDFPAIVNGSASFELDRLLMLRLQVAGFPDASSVALLRRLGVRTVILHPDLAAGTPWQGASAKPVAGLPLRLEDRGDVVLYHLEPLSRAG